MNIFDFLYDCNGFQWDEYNSQKIWIKHKVTPLECEQTFFNRPFIVADDVIHSQVEKRFYALGKTDINKKLFIVFTIRKKLIRVILARKMSVKEKRSYDEYEKK